MQFKTPVLLRRTLIGAVLLALPVAFIIWKTQPKPIAVTLRPVDRGKVEATLANTRSGTIEACQRTRLSPIIGGRIESLLVKEGDPVKKGQLLLKLWNDDQQAQSTLAAAQLEISKKRVGEACTLAANAQREAKRSSELRQRGFIAQSKEEASHAEAESRQAACETVRADIKQAEARLALTRVEQGRTRLVAPFDGIVAKIVGDLGEYTTPSPPGVATPPAIDLIDPSCLYVKAPMDEVDAPKIHPGQITRVTLDALPGRSFAAQVKRIAPVVSAVEKQARTVDVEVRFTRQAETNGLLVGYSADVEIILASKENTLRIASTALQEGGRVLLFNPASNTLEQRLIKTGVANWEFTEVLEGLQEGDRVVTSLEREGIKAGALVFAEETAKSEKK